MDGCILKSGSAQNDAKNRQKENQNDCPCNRHLPDTPESRLAEKPQGQVGGKQRRKGKKYDKKQNRIHKNFDSSLCVLFYR
jgi:hypothetical protein